MNENNTHPLTEARAAELWGDHAPAYLGQWRSMSDDRRAHAVHLLRVAHNAGRAHERDTDPEDDRPWEPLGQDDPLHAGDEVWREWRGVSTRGIVYAQRFDSQVYTAERGHLGHRGIGTWYVRRRIPELPTEDGAVIMHLNEVEAIRAKDNTGRLNDFHRLTYDAGTETWYGMDLDGNLRWTTSQEIVPGTWRAA